MTHNEARMILQAMRCKNADNDQSLTSKNELNDGLQASSLHAASIYRV